MPEEDLRKNRMMAHLLDALDQGQDIGHNGRFVFASVARHFMDEDEVVRRLAGDRDESEDEARALVRQIQKRDYNPPRRERILEMQARQDFAIIPDPEDPDDGNVYRDLEFPDHVYEHIQEYREAKSQADDD